MNVRRTGLVLGVLSCVAVALLALAAVQRQAPGRVSVVHGRIEELAGGEACAACHGGWFGDMLAACSECHPAIAEQRRDRRGLHGSLAPELAAACPTCHGEHHGDEFQLVNRLAWTLAGVPDVRTFDHGRIGFPLAGVHATLACTECHRHAETAVVPEGQQRYLGLRQDCASCHGDPHGGRMQLACTTCHDQESFAAPAVLDHERWLPLHGAHAQVACRQCHAADGPHALEAYAPAAAREVRRCGDCHEAPHSRAFVAGNAAAAQQPEDTVCAICHPLDLPRFGDPRVEITPAQHAHGGFPLLAPHDRAACAQCHLPTLDWAGRHPGRAADDCRRCHEDPHGGQFDARAAAAGGCLECHARTHFAPHGFDQGRHARTRLPLDGRHAELECAACHRDPAEGAARAFTGTSHRCEQCHDDAHDGAFAAHDGELAAAPRGRCAVCHGTRAFAQVDHAAFAHERWTGFAVDGAHAQIECTDCHARAATADAAGRRFGRVPPHGPGVAECTTCHPDPHAGSFDAAGAPATIDGRSGCRRCHDTVSFRALPHGFDHARATGHALQGAHAALDCAACHARLPAPDGNGRTWARAAGRTCADCHRDPHAGQFEQNGGTDCARCHKNQERFRSVSFRHNLDSRFPLSEAHEQVACSGCHKPEPKDGIEVVRYRPLPTECVDCHGREQGAPTRRRRQ
jgi:hypothetical protein